MPMREQIICLRLSMVNTNREETNSHNYTLIQTTFAVEYSLINHKILLIHSYVTLRYGH